LTRDDWRRKKLNAWVCNILYLYLMIIYIHHKLYYFKIITVGEAEKYRSDKEEAEIKIQVRNSLESYAYNLRNILQVIIINIT
jgi:hypothetical protein